MVKVEVGPRRQVVVHHHHHHHHHQGATVEENPQTLTMIMRTITKPMLAAISMAPNTESNKMLRNETSF